MGEILGINYLAIDFIFKLYKIEDEWDRQCLFEKITTVDRVRVLSARRRTEREIAETKRKSGRHK